MKNRCRTSLVCFVALAASQVAWFTAAGAQDSEKLRRLGPGDVEPAYTFKSVPPGARVHLRGRAWIEGPSPLGVPADVQGTYRFEVSDRGYEAQRGTVELPGGAQPLSLLGGPFVGLGAGQVIRSVAWPGLVHFAHGDPVRGWGWFSAGTGAVFGAIFSQLDVLSGNDDVDSARRLLELSRTPDNVASATAGLIDAESRQQAARRARNDYLILAGALWGLSAVDRYFLTPRLADARAASMTLEVDLQPLSRGEAMARSLVPGLGQLYAGRSGPASLFVFGAIGTGFAALIAEHRYDQAVDELAGLQAVYDDPRTDPEILSRLRGDLVAQADEADSRRTLRNTLVGVAAAVWVANLVDAFLGAPRPYESGGTSLGLELGLRRERLLAIRVPLGAGTSP